MNNRTPASLRMPMAFAALSLLLLVQVLWVNLHQGAGTWQQYQRLYFQQEGISQSPRVVELTLASGQAERCQTCHLGIEEISASHPVEVFGCTSCHGGNGLSLDQDEAHRGLRGGGNPADLRVAAQSCGTGPAGEACHAGREHPELDPVLRIAASPMASKAGEINQVRYAFGLTTDLERPAFPVDGSPAEIASPLGGHVQEKTFQENCLDGCHLWDGAHGDTSRTYSGGCAACHYLYNPSSTYEGKDVTIPKDEPGHGAIHRLTASIPYTQCNVCHNQGIHSLASMTFEQRADLPTPRYEPTSLESAWAARVRDYYIPGETYARCEVSLDCIDCHGRHDTMGDPRRDGSPAGTKAQAQSVRCSDCHGSSLAGPDTLLLSSPDEYVFSDPRRLQEGFPSLQVGDRIAVTSAGELLPFTRVADGGQVTLYSKVTGKAFDVPLVFGSACEQDPADQSADACHRCHDVSKTAHAQPPTR